MNIQTKSNERAPLTAEQSEAITNWIKADAVRLKTVEAENGFDDLQPLKEILKNVRVVGLGEATHGTREFFQAKHRLFEFLATEMGFTLFGIETSYPECLNINDYVLYGQGDIDEVVASQGFWIYNTEEVTEMVEWMRKYNETMTDENKKVRFYGFDVQRHGQSIQVVSEFLKKVDPDFEHGLEDLDEILLSTRVEREKREERRKTRGVVFDKILRIAGHLAVHRFKFTNATSKEEFQKADAHVRNLYEYFDMFTAENASLARDYYMAQNCRILMDEVHPGAKMVLWAHNGHLSAYNVYEPMIMGKELRDAYGDGYYVVGFMFSEGGFQAVDAYAEALAKKNSPDGRTVQINFVKDHYLDSTGEGMEQYFLKAGIPISFTDLRSAPKDGPVSEFLDKPQLAFSRGSHHADSTPPPEWEGEPIYPEPTLNPRHVPRKMYDGLLYVQKTTPARMNPTPPPVLT